MTISFTELCSRKALQDKRKLDTNTLLSLDPGETTGWAVFRKTTLIKAGQINTKSIVDTVRNIEELITNYSPDLIVIEDYRIYEWKTKTHSWNKVHTVRVIGCILTLAVQRSLKVISRLAINPKTFCTDKKLKEWGFYIKGERHTRDAIRHGCYQLIFGDGMGKGVEVNPQDIV